MIMICPKDTEMNWKHLQWPNMKHFEKQNKGVIDYNSKYKNYTMSSSWYK